MEETGTGRDAFAPGEIAKLRRIGEHLAAACLEYEGASPAGRACYGLRCCFEAASLPGWGGEPLYPCGRVRLPRYGRVVTFSYTDGVCFLPGAVEELRALPGEGAAADLADRAGRELERIFGRDRRSIPAEHALGGAGYTHGIINYGRVLREGLDGYASRIEAAASGPEADHDFYGGLNDLVIGLRAMQQRIIDCIAVTAAEESDPGPARMLTAALERVPFRPARSFYEAMVAVNLLWYLDGCDSLGRFDQDLGFYLEADLAEGLIGRDEARDLVRLLFRNVDVNDGWNMALGGTLPDGRHACNALTEICLESIVGMRRPNLALRVGRNTPERVMDLAVDAIAAGCGMPALYNEEAYLREVPRIFGEMGGDQYSYAFGGCTETMVHGCSNVGSIDGGINLLAVLAGTIRKDLASCEDFEGFYEAFLADMRRVVSEAAATINGEQRRKAFFQPQPLRSLLCDDCIGRGIDFNAGGARYNGGVFNLGGLANVVDSLVVIRDLIFGGTCTPTEILTALDDDFRGHEELLRLIQSKSRYGNDDDGSDRLAAAVAGAAFAEVRRHRSWRGGTPLMPSCIMFTTYGRAGRSVGATPDGRRSGTPVVDSTGPVPGRDSNGPTAMLRSVCSLPLREAAGTPVLNARFAPEIFRSTEGRGKFLALLKAYFDLGGMQMQVTVADQDLLRRAMENPADYDDLIIRIGGYSEYFNRLTPELKISVIQRTEYC